MVRSVGSSGDNFETGHRRKDGSTVQVEISTNGAICGGQKLVFCVCRDITERKKIEQKLSKMATHDALTELPNRLLLTDRFDISVARAKRNAGNVSIMMLDLDHFKYVNDTLGHDIGDKLLKAIGNMLKGIVRKSDTVARMGGDEFVLLLPEVNDLQNIQRIAQKILDDFKKPFPINGHNLLITTSIGIAVYPSDGEDFESLMTSADKAMYYAKESGRNNYKFAHSSNRVEIV
jgi:diguanylate cyclase (GGDEF)-like protein